MGVREGRPLCPGGTVTALIQSRAVSGLGTGTPGAGTDSPGKAVGRVGRAHHCPQGPHSQHTVKTIWLPAHAVLLLCIF